jgi:hypothetical protein
MTSVLADLAEAIDGMSAEPGQNETRTTVRPRTLRGDICALLNPMVRDGAITSFRTNLSDKPLPRELVVTVRAIGQGGADDAFRIVTQALAPLAQAIIVSVGKPDLPEVQAPAAAA